MVHLAVFVADSCWLTRAAPGSDVTLGTVCCLSREKCCLWAKALESTTGY